MQQQQTNKQTKTKQAKTKQIIYIQQFNYIAFIFCNCYIELYKVRSTYKNIVTDPFDFLLMKLCV